MKQDNINDDALEVRTPPVFDLAARGIEMLDIEGMDDPFPLYRELREAGPIIALQGRGITYYHVNGWDAAMAALRDKRFSKDQSHMMAAVAPTGRSGPQAGFALSGGTGKGHLLNTNPPEHTRLRNLVSQAFSPRQIAAQEQVIAAMVDERLEALSGQKEADLVADYAYPIAITMICRILGVPASDRDKFRIWATAASTPHVVTGAAVSQAEGAQMLNGYLAEHIVQVRERIRSGQKSEDADVLTAMAQAQSEHESGLTDQELQSMAFLLLIAGHETTVGLISAALLRLARHPDQRQMLVDRPELMSTALEEFLRMDGSVQRTTFRVATEDIDIAGYRIPKGGVTIVTLPTANRDPSHFPDPDRFDITRKGQPNLAFGTGVHFCLGFNLARAETRLAVGGFIRRFPDYQVGTPRWARTVIRAPLTLPVVLGREVRT